MTFVGELLATPYGAGKVIEQRETSVVLIPTTWLLAKGQKPIFYLNPADTKPLFAINSQVTTQYGSGKVIDIRQADGVYIVLLDTWHLATGKSPILFLQGETLQLTSVMGDVAPVVEEVVAFVGEVVAAVTPVVEEVVAVVEEVVTPVVEEVVAAVTPVVEEVVAVVEEVVTPVVEEVVAAVSPVVEEVVAAVTPVVEEVVAAVTPVVEEVVAAVEEVVTPVVEEVVTPVVEEVVAPVVEEVVAPVVEEVVTPVVVESAAPVAQTFSVGDKIISMYGKGVVREIRSPTSLIVQPTTWLLANDKAPIFYLNVESAMLESEYEASVSSPASVAEESKTSASDNTTPATPAAEPVKKKGCVIS